MKKSEVAKLKKQYYLELERVRKINELSKRKDILEFLRLQGINFEELSEDILDNILKNFKVSETNGILVCTGNYYTDCRICYEETNYQTVLTKFDSSYTEFRTYRNIENEKFYLGYMKDYIKSICGNETIEEYCKKNGFRLSSAIERTFTVLNPYNKSDGDNGYQDVRREFFMTTINKGQPSSKSLILSKYNHM